MLPFALQALRLQSTDWSDESSASSVVDVVSAVTGADVNLQSVTMPTVQEPSASATHTSHACPTVHMHTCSFAQQLGAEK